jgi:hypothetical protein
MPTEAVIKMLTVSERDSAGYAIAQARQPIY